MSRYNDPDVLELAGQLGGRKRRALAEIKRAEAEERNERTLPQRRAAYWREQADLACELDAGPCLWPEKTPYENYDAAIAALKGITAHKRKLQGLHPYPCRAGHYHLGRKLRRASVAWRRAA